MNRIKALVRHVAAAAVLAGVLSVAASPSRGADVPRCQAASRLRSGEIIVTRASAKNLS